MLNGSLKQCKLFEACSMKKEELLRFFVTSSYPQSKKEAQAYLIKQGIDPDAAKRRFLELVRSGKKNEDRKC